MKLQNTIIAILFAALTSITHSSHISITFRKSIFGNDYVASITNLDTTLYSGIFLHRNIKQIVNIPAHRTAEFGWMQGYKIYGNSIVELIPQSDGDTIRSASPSDIYLNGYYIEIKPDGIYFSISLAYLQGQVAKSLEKVKPITYGPVSISLGQYPSISADEASKRLKIQISLVGSAVIGGKNIPIVPVKINASAYPYIDKNSDEVRMIDGQIDTIKVFGDSREYSEYARNFINLLLPSILKSQAIPIPEDLKRYIAGDCIQKFTIEDGRIKIPISITRCAAEYFRPKE